MLKNICQQILKLVKSVSNSHERLGLNGRGNAKIWEKSDIKCQIWSQCFILQSSRCISQTRIYSTQVTFRCGPVFLCGCTCRHNVTYDMYCNHASLPVDGSNPFWSADQSGVGFCVVWLSRYQLNYSHQSWVITTHVWNGWICNGPKACGNMAMGHGGQSAVVSGECRNVLTSHSLYAVNWCSPPFPTQVVLQHLCFH